MGFDERLSWWLLGCAIGFVVGYIVRSLRDIKEELNEVDEIVKKKWSSDEGGFMRMPILGDVALIFVICLTVWAAFASQKATNDVKANTETIKVMTICNQEFLDKTIQALNERTRYSAEHANANVRLQRAQAEYLNLYLQEPPTTSEEQREGLKRYFDALTDFVTVTAKFTTKVEQYPYPTNEELEDCLTSEGE